MRPLMNTCQILILLVAVPSVAAAAQEVEHVKKTLFNEANEKLRAAREAQADLLAPKSFREAMKRYREAEEDFGKGKGLEDIREKLRAARQYFEKAINTTELARVALAPALGARADAQAAEAPEFAPEGWERAERKFRDAAREVEDGDVKDGRERAAEAVELYRRAELAAIKTNYLQDTWALLEQAEKLDVEDRAPATLERARQLAAAAEKKLNESRYDTDEPRSLARQAQYEARHAIQLARTIESVREGDRTLEDLIVGAESELARIAHVVGVRPAFDEGLDATADAIVAAVAGYGDSVSALTRDLAEREQRIATYEARVAELESQVGDVVSEKSALARRLEDQAELRRTFAAVERLFAPDEARVLRERYDVILRLHGLNFPVGSATIEPANFGLLTKVQRAIDMFPGCTVTIEGHTDSFGGDESNMKLSLKRARAVQAYLLANMNIQPSRVESVGYGEDRPIATNETAEGRKKNRRIDVVIHPKYE